MLKAIRVPYDVDVSKFSVVKGNLLFVFFAVENKYSTYEQRVASIPSDALYKQMNVLDKVTENALKVRNKFLRWSLKVLAILSF